MICRSIIIAAPRKAVFAVYEDVSSWPEWDEGLFAVSLPGGLAVGSSGWLQPAGGPRAKITVTEVAAGRSFTVESRLPLCRMIFTHSLEDEGAGTRAVHCIGFQGALAFLFRRLAGPAVERSLMPALTGLKRRSEGAQA